MLSISVLVTSLVLLLQCFASAKQAPLPAHKSLHNKQKEPSPWKRLNNPIVKHTGSKAFTITAPPATDIWRPNVTADNFTAPYVYRVCKTADFQRIAVTITADWKTRYDQGGIAIFFPGKKPYKWIKTGIEMENGVPQLGTVTTYAFSDWSLSPVVPKGTKSATFLVERNTSE